MDSTFNLTGYKISPPPNNKVILLHSVLVTQFVSFHGLLCAIVTALFEIFSQHSLDNIIISLCNSALFSYYLCCIFYESAPSKMCCYRIGVLCLRVLGRYISLKI